MSRVLVTGSAGFVGQVVVRRLLELGHEVVGLDSLVEQVHGPLARFNFLDDRDYELIRANVGEIWLDEDYDAVVHLAAHVGVGQSMYEPARYVQNNSFQTALFLEELAKRKPRRLVVASSMSVYGEGPHYLTERFGTTGTPAPTKEDYPPHLHSIYALTKYDQEQLCLIWGRANKVTTVALRFFNIYGPGQALSNPYTGVMAIFASRLLNDKQPIVYEDGQQSRDFVHVMDVAEAVVQAATTNMEGTYNVGTGVARTIESVALDLARVLGKPIKPLITGQHREGDIRHCFADVTKLRATGWEPRVSWEEGLQGYVEWLKEQPRPEDKFDKAAEELKQAGLLK